MKIIFQIVFVYFTFASASPFDSSTSLNQLEISIRESNAAAEKLHTVLEDIAVTLNSVLEDKIRVDQTPLVIQSFDNLVRTIENFKGAFVNFQHANDLNLKFLRNIKINVTVPPNKDIVNVLNKIYRTHNHTNGILDSVEQAISSLNITLASTPYNNFTEFVYGNSSFQYSKFFTYQNGDKLHWSIFGGLLGALETLINKLISIFLSLLKELILEIVKPLLTLLINLLVDFIPVLETLVDLLLTLIESLLRTLLNLLTLVNKKYYLLESLLLLIFVYFISRDYIVSLVYCCVFVVVSGFVRHV